MVRLRFDSVFGSARKGEASSHVERTTVNSEASRARDEKIILRRTGGLALNVIVVVFASRTTGVDATHAAYLLSVSLLATGLVTYDAKTGPAGAGTVFVGVFGLFHVGLVIAYATAGDTVLVGGGDNSWVAGDQLGPATFSTSLGLLALSVGYCLVPRSKRFKGPARSRRKVSRERLKTVGWLSVVVGLSIMTPTLLTVGLGGGYESLLASAEGSNYGYGTLILGFGLIFLVHAGGRTRNTAWVVGGVIGTTLLIMGTRGTVIFTAVALFFVAGRSVYFRWRYVLAGSVVTLGGISVLRQTRLHGITGLTSGKWSFSPAEGLAEMGYSLYPVYVVDRWMLQGSDPWWGVSLIAVPLRFIESLLGISRPSPDMRLFNIEIQERVGPIGGSPVAEGLRNGGNVFVFLLLGLIGILLAHMQRQNQSLGILVSAVLILPLLAFSRNTFGPVPIQWGLGLVLVFAATRPAFDRHLVKGTASNGVGADPFSERGSG